jgi:hypothetical protein
MNRELSERVDLEDIGLLAFVGVGSASTVSTAPEMAVGLVPIGALLVGLTLSRRG